MGMSLLHNRWNDIPQNTISYSVIKLTEKKMQMYKLTVIQSTYEMSVIFVYINKTPTLSEVKEIGNVLKDENANFILGDFNIDRNKEDGIQKINELSKVFQDFNELHLCHGTFQGAALRQRRGRLRTPK